MRTGEEEVVEAVEEGVEVTTATIKQRRRRPTGDTSLASYIKRAREEETAYQAEEGARRAQEAEAARKPREVVEAARIGVLAQDTGGEVVVRFVGSAYELLRHSAAAASRAFDGPRPDARFDAGDMALLTVVAASPLAGAYTFGQRVRDAVAGLLGGPAGVLAYQQREVLEDLDVELTVEGLRDPASLSEVCADW